MQTFNFLKNRFKIFAPFLCHAKHSLQQQHQQLLEQEQKNKPPQPGSRNLPPTPDTQRLVAEINALKQRLQETGARSENELEQWRKVVEQEKIRADQAEKAAQELIKRTQALEKVRQTSGLFFSRLFKNIFRTNISNFIHFDV